MSAVLLRGPCACVEVTVGVEMRIGCPALAKLAATSNITADDFTTDFSFSRTFLQLAQIK